MRDIAKLLFGDDTGKLLDMFSADEGEESGMADRARRSGEWCGTTPGRGSAAAAVKRAARPRRGRGQITIRIRGW
jgi:hypothetical protein